MAVTRTRTGGVGRKAAPAAKRAGAGRATAVKGTAGRKAASKIAGAARSAKAAETSSTVTLRQMAATIAETHELPRKTAEAVMGDLVTLMVRHLKKGRKLRLSGFGILEVKKRAPRKGRNPRTGEEVKIKASKRVAFRASKELKDAL